MPVKERRAHHHYCVMCTTIQLVDKNQKKKKKLKCRSTQVVSTSFSTRAFLKGILDWVNLQFFSGQIWRQNSPRRFLKTFSFFVLVSWNLHQEKKTSIENYWCSYYSGFSFWFIYFECIVSSVLIQNFLCLCKIWRGPFTSFYVSLLISVRMYLSCLLK